MKIWIINNTKFGYKNKSNMMFDYFYNYLIPFIKKNKSPDDILIHLGNIFNSIDNINVKLLLDVKKLFKTLSGVIETHIIKGKNEKNNITDLLDVNVIKSSEYNYFKLDELNIENEYVFINEEIDTDILGQYNNLYFVGYYDNRKEDGNIIRVGCPYPLDKEIKESGIYVLDVKTKKYKYIKNNYSPKYDTITITDIDQIDELDQEYIDNNFIDVIIDKKLVDEKKLKIDILLNKFSFKSITYINDEEEIEEVKSLDLDTVIYDKIKSLNDEDILKEYENIIKLYNEKY